MGHSCWFYLPLEAAGIPRMWDALFKAVRKSREEKTGRAAGFQNPRIRNRLCACGASAV